MKLERKHSRTRNLRALRWDRLRLHENFKTSDTIFSAFLSPEAWRVILISLFCFVLFAAECTSNNFKLHPIIIGRIESFKESFSSLYFVLRYCSFLWTLNLPSPVKSTDFQTFAYNFLCTTCMQSRCYFSLRLFWKYKFEFLLLSLIERMGGKNDDVYLKHSSFQTLSK